MPRNFTAFSQLLADAEPGRQQLHLARWPNVPTPSAEKPFPLLSYTGAWRNVSNGSTAGCVSTLRNQLMSLYFRRFSDRLLAFTDREHRAAAQCGQLARRYHNVSSLLYCPHTPTTATTATTNHCDHHPTTTTT